MQVIHSTNDLSIQLSKKGLPLRFSKLTSHVIIVHCLHQQLRVLDAIYDAKKSPCQTQQFTKAVEAKVDKIVGKTDNLGRETTLGR